MCINGRWENFYLINCTNLKYVFYPFSRDSQLIDNRLTFGKKIPVIEEILVKHFVFSCFKMCTYVTPDPFTLMRNSENKRDFIQSKKIFWKLICGWLHVTTAPHMTLRFDIYTNLFTEFCTIFTSPVVLGVSPRNEW